MRKVFSKIQIRNILPKSLGFWTIAFLFVYSVILTLAPTVKYHSFAVNLRWSHWIGFLIWIIGYLLFNKIQPKNISRNDSLLINTVILLIGWGIMSIWRLRTYFGFRQSIWFLFCVLSASLFYRNKQAISKIRELKYLILLFGVLLVALTFLFGTYPGGEGPQLWLGARGVYFQPSELLKLLFIIYLAAYFSDPKLQFLSISRIVFPSLILLLISLIIIIAQRDLGTALIFISIYIFMIFIKIKRKRVLLSSMLTSLVVGVMGYYTIDLIRIRLGNWINPWMEAQTSSYQIIQAIIAIASGGLFGTGIGLGRPDFIPISHSDFIFASIIEETGLFGMIGLLILYVIICFQLMKIAVQTKNLYCQFLAFGVGVYLLTQSLLIMGGNIRLLPITGVPLPFISYGGSSLLVSFSAIILVDILSDETTEKQTYSEAIGPIKIVTGFFVVGLISVGMVAGWWALIRSRDLQLREDNPRHLITAKFVPRGDIFDRSGENLATTIGETGSYSRVYSHPELSNTIGYINQRYGLAGIEKTQDEYLSGFKGYPASVIWFNYILYDEPPPGRDIRLSISLRLQKFIDELLEDYHASAIALNTETGEVLAMASHPNYDANNLIENFENWADDENAPFLNRSIQGAYPAGELLTPLFMAIDNPKNLLDISPDYRVQISSDYPECAMDVGKDRTIKNLVTQGCTTALHYSLFHSGETLLPNTIDTFSLDTTPEIGLPINEVLEFNSKLNWKEKIYGNNPIRLSPLTAASAFSVFSNGGLASTLDLVTAVDIQDEGWIIISNPNQYRLISTETANNIVNLLGSNVINGWELTARGKDANSVASWYIAGTNPDWQGNPVLVVVVIEGNVPDEVQKIGRKIFESTISE